MRLLLATVAAHELTFFLNGENRHVIFDESNVDATALSLAEHGLAGEGCTTTTCVAAMLSTAMRRRLGNTSAHGVTRVTVATEVARAQGALEVERQERLYERPATTPARRTVRAPCVPPYCDVECATFDSLHEKRLAFEFVASDPELSRLMSEDPSPRECPTGRILPIFFGIPARDVVECVPRKFYGFQSDFGMAADSTKIDRFGVGMEAEHKRAYREAYFGETKMKSGWDCMRHYEIVASGSVPYWVGPPDITQCPAGRLAFWPKALLKRITQLRGVDGPNRRVNASKLDAGGTYAEVAAGLLEYARARLTTRALADYVLRATGHVNATTVLVLSSHPDPDYMRDMLVHGFRDKLGSGCVDFIRPQHLYAPAPGTDRAPRDTNADAGLYGHGFSYARRLRDNGGSTIDRSNIEARIRARAFDVVVYASVQRGMPYWPTVQETYASDDIVFVDGEDDHGWSNFSTQLPSQGHFFMREMPDGCPN